MLLWKVKEGNIFYRRGIEIEICSAEKMMVRWCWMICCWVGMVHRVSVCVWRSATSDGGKFED